MVIGVSPRVKERKNQRTTSLCFPKTKIKRRKKKKKKPVTEA